MGISKHELVTMLEEEELKDAALVVFANKQVINRLQQRCVLASACSRREQIEV
jgi:hypothetical protein